MLALLYCQEQGFHFGIEDEAERVATELVGNQDREVRKPFLSFLLNANPTPNLTLLYTSSCLSKTLLSGFLLGTKSSKREKMLEEARPSNTPLSFWTSISRVASGPVTGAEYSATSLTGAASAEDMIFTCVATSCLFPPTEKYTRTIPLWRPASPVGVITTLLLVGTLVGWVSQYVSYVYDKSKLPTCAKTSTKCFWVFSFSAFSFCSTSTLPTPLVYRASTPTP